MDFADQHTKITVDLFSVLSRKVHADLIKGEPHDPRDDIGGVETYGEYYTGENWRLATDLSIVGCAIYYPINFPYTKVRHIDHRKRLIAWPQWVFHDVAGDLPLHQIRREALKSEDWAKQLAFYRVIYAGGIGPVFISGDGTRSTLSFFTEEDAVVVQAAMDSA